MSKSITEKKLNKNGEIINVKLSPIIKQKYNNLELYKKCDNCGNYYDYDQGCPCVILN